MEKIEVFRCFLQYKIDFESQILALSYSYVKVQVYKYLKVSQKSIMC